MSDEEYILFLDESNKTTNNPYFCLAGFITTRKHYNDKVIPSINNLKIKHLPNASIPLHYTDIKNSQRDFQFLKENSSLRNTILYGISQIITSCDITTMGVYFDEKVIRLLYGDKNLYSIAFFEILKQYTYFLKEKDALGSICIESRVHTDNKRLQDSYYSYLTNGSAYFNDNIAGKHLTSLSIIFKEDNCAGLQLADFVPISLLKKINGHKSCYGLLNAVDSKLYKNGTKFKEILGIRKIL